jgi:hypothetical protein
MTKFSLYTSTVQSNYVLDDLALRGLIRTSYKNITGFDTTSGKTNIIAIHLPPNVQVNYTNEITFSALTCSDKICGYNDVVQLLNGAYVSYTVVPYPVDAPDTVIQGSSTRRCDGCPGGKLAAQHEFMEAVSRAALKTNYNYVIPEIADYCDSTPGRYSYYGSGVMDFGSSFHSLWSPLTGRCEPSSSTPPASGVTVSTSSKFSSKFYTFKILPDPVVVNMHSCNPPSPGVRNYSTADFAYSTVWNNPATRFVFQFYNGDNGRWVKIFNPNVAYGYSAMTSGNLLYVTRPAGTATTAIQGTVSFSSEQGNINDCYGPTSNRLQGSLVSMA